MDAAALELLKSLGGKLDGLVTGLNTTQASIAAVEARVKAVEDSTRERLAVAAGGDNKPIPKGTWSWARFCLATATKDWSVAPFEHAEVKAYSEMRQKIMTTDQFTGGGSFIPPQYVNELYEFIRPRLITGALGVRVITGLTGSPVVFPKTTSGTSAYWVGEDEAPTESAYVVGRTEMTPRKLGVLVKLTNDLIMLSNPSMETLVRTDIARSIAEAIDIAFFRGTGTNGQPLGIDNQSPTIGSGTYTNTDAETKIKSFMLMLKDLETNGVLSDVTAFAMNPVSYWALQALADTTKRNLFNADLTVSRTERFLGYPIQRSTLVSPAGTDAVYVGDWSTAIIAMWSALRIAASTETSTAFEKDELWIRAFTHCDVGLRTEKAIFRMASVSA